MNFQPYHYHCNRCDRDFWTFKKDKRQCPYKDCRSLHWNEPKPAGETRGRPRKNPDDPKSPYVRKVALSRKPKPKRKKRGRPCKAQSDPKGQHVWRISPTSEAEVLSTDLPATAD